MRSCLLDRVLSFQFTLFFPSLFSTGFLRVLNKGLLICLSHVMMQVQSCPALQRQFQNVYFMLHLSSLNKEYSLL